MREYVSVVKDWVHSAKSNFPRWFVVWSLSLMLVISPAAIGISGAQSSGAFIFDDFEDGDVDGWELTNNDDMTANTSHAYEGQYAGRYHPQSATSARLDIPTDQYEYVSFVIYVDQDAFGEFSRVSWDWSGESVDGMQTSITDDGSVMVSGDDTGQNIQTRTFYRFRYTPNYGNGTFNVEVLDANGNTLFTVEDASTDASNTDYFEINAFEQTDVHIDFLVGESGKSTISGEVLDQNGDPVENATVSVTQNNTEITSSQTGPQGGYNVLVDNGTYTITASAPGYFNDSANVTVSGEDVTQNFELLEISEALTIDTRNYLKHGQSAEYVVTFSSDGGSNRVDITDQAEVTSNNTSVVTVNQIDNEIVATSNESVNERTYIQANYSENGQTYVAQQNVTVANSTVENLAILPTIWRVNATFGSSTIQAILVALFAGIFGARVSTSFGGLALMQLMMVAAWFTGYATVGITMISLFAALFIGLNMAANIDYTVRQ